MYIPFQVEHDELEDISFQLENPKLFRATFYATGLYEPMKNKYTSEIALKGEVIDLVHISLFGYEIQSCDKGAMLSLSISRLQEYLDNDTAYFYFRLPQKSLMKMCEKTDDAKILLRRMRDLISSPMQLEKYGHSVRINEARRLPDTITKQGGFIVRSWIRQSLASASMRTIVSMRRIAIAYSEWKKTSIKTLHRMGMTAVQPLHTFGERPERTIKEGISVSISICQMRSSAQAAWPFT